MRVKRFSTTRDEELKCTDPESYIDENGILYPLLAKMPIQDLSLIANFRVETMKRYYTGDIREVDYPIVELLGMTSTVSATEANQQNTEEQQDTESVVLRMQYSSK